MRPIAGTAIALEDGQHRWSFDALQAQVELAADALRSRGVRVLATLMDNSAAWVIADRAAARAGIVHVPLPVFFSQAQIGHALAACGADGLLLGPELAAHWPLAAADVFSLGGQRLHLLRLPAKPVALPDGTSKITFTSGTTGAPKGVCLSEASMEAVAAGLVAAMEPLDIRRHLCALPFAVLLENIAGVSAPLAHGATCLVPPLSQLGLAGSSSFDAGRFHEAVCRHAPESIILLPQMLRAWVGHLAGQRQRAPGSLKLVAVGGAAVGAPLKRPARTAFPPTKAMACPRAHRSRHSTCPARTARARRDVRCRTRGCASPRTAKSRSAAASSWATWEKRRQPATGGPPATSGASIRTASSMSTGARRTC